MGIVVISLLLSGIVIYLYENRNRYSKKYLILGLLIAIFILPSKIVSMVLIGIICYIVIKLGREEYRKQNTLNYQKS